MAYSAALNAVYNHYLQTYSQPRSSRYDTHKKSELRSIYNSIIEQNRKAPLFLLENPKNTHEFAVGLKENARTLRNTIAALGGLEEGGIVNKKTAFSSNPDIVEAIFVGDNENIDNAPTFDIVVNRLATGQANTGHMLLSDERVELPVGFYSFDVSINETNFEFQFNINEGETNIDIQKRLARLFKNADLGLTASIFENNGYTALNLMANSTGRVTGREVQFTISDDKTSKASGSVVYLGLDRIARQAENAEFLLNGDMKTAHANNFTVEKMYELSLLGVNNQDDPPVHIGLKTSVESISDNVTKLIDGYNKFLEASLNLGDGQFRNRQIINEMRSITRRYDHEMTDLGFSIDYDNGFLSLSDNNKLKQTLSWEADAEDDESPGIGLQTLKSFTSAILRKSTQITLNPMEYVDKKIIAYKNPERAFVNPYMASAYSGLMFNSYC